MTVFHDGLTSGGGFFIPAFCKLENTEREMNDELTKILISSDEFLSIIPVCAITGALANRHVQANGAVTVPLTALIAALHPLDKPWGLL